MKHTHTTTSPIHNTSTQTQTNTDTQHPSPAQPTTRPQPAQTLSPSRPTRPLRGLPRRQAVTPSSTQTLFSPPPAAAAPAASPAGQDSAHATPGRDPGLQHDHGRQQGFGHVANHRAESAASDWSAEQRRVQPQAGWRASHSGG